MITGTTMTAQEAVNKHPTTSLAGRQCVVVTSLLGDGTHELHLGEIVDPADCVIDEPDGALLYVEYQKDGDYLLASVYADDSIVLLDEVAA